MTKMHIPAETQAFLTFKHKIQQHPPNFFTNVELVGQNDLVSFFRYRNLLSQIIDVRWLAGERVGQSTNCGTGICTPQEMTCGGAGLPVPVAVMSCTVQWWLVVVLGPAAVRSRSQLASLCSARLNLTSDWGAAGQNITAVLEVTGTPTALRLSFQPDWDRMQIFPASIQVHLDKLSRQRPPDCAAGRTGRQSG